MDPLLSLFDQTARLIELKTPLPGSSLIVECFTGREAVSESFRFEIDCVSTNAFFELKPLLGEEVTLKLLQADGGKRAWHGYVTGAMQLGADGGLARYRLVMESCLAYLGQRRDCYVFQNGTSLDFIGQVLADYPEIDWANQVTQTLRPRSLAIQYRETDLDLLLRLLGEEGLSFRFEHDQNAQAGDIPLTRAASHARHKLVIFDRDSELPVGRQAVIRFHRNHATESSDTLQTWQETRSVCPNAVTLAGWDYKTLVATGAQAHSTLDNGELPRLEIHDASQPYRFENNAAAQLRTDLALAASESRTRRFTGHGTVRQLAAGTSVALSQHAAYQGEDARFAILAVEHHGANNLGAQIAQLLGTPDVERGTYRNTLTAQPAALPIVSAPRPKPRARPQTALVVGLTGQVNHTERDHRIKIQFPWQRGASPNPGGLTETGPAGRTAGKTGNAPGNDQSGTWTRVAEWLSGPNWGSHFLPRIGSEVLVDFLDGDIDRPIVVGQSYNGTDLPPFPAGHQSGANHPGVLSGWMSHNHEAGFNQWLIDDAPGQLRTRLATSENAGQLSLGHLIHQSPESAQRGAWRGSGFELRTDGWLAVRANEGILLSATARPNGQGTQMDVAETVSQLKAAAETARALSDAAQRQQALPLKAHTAQSAFLKAIDPEQDGKHDGAVGGQEARKALPASRTLGKSTERFAQAFIVNEAPSDIGLSSPASTLLFAGGNLHATVQQDLHIASAHTVSAAIGEGASWFAHAGGIKSIAQAGSLTIQAHTDRMDILADQSITVTSVNDEIHLLAKEKIVLQAGQSSVTLEGGNITFACPGKFSVKGSGQAFLGPGRGEASLPALPTGKTEIKDWIGLDYRDPETGEAIADAGYEIHFAGGSVLTGKLDGQGLAQHDSVERKAVTKVVYKPRQPDEDKPHMPLNELLA